MNVVFLFVLFLFFVSYVILERVILMCFRVCIDLDQNNRLIKFYLFLTNAVL